MKYTPIDCNFYDILEASAVLKKVVVIEYKDEQEKICQTNTRIVDLFIKEKVEYMKLENDLVIRLDFIHSVDGQILNGSCAI